MKIHVEQLVGYSDVMEILDLPAPTLSKRIARGKFPDPIAYVNRGNTMLWLLSDIINEPARRKCERRKK